MYVYITYNEKKGVKSSGTFIADNHYFLNSVRKSKFQVQDGYLEYFVFGDLGI